MKYTVWDCNSGPRSQSFHFAYTVNGNRVTNNPNGLYISTQVADNSFVKTNKVINLNNLNWESNTYIEFEWVACKY